MTAVDVCRWPLAVGIQLGAAGEPRNRDEDRLALALAAYKAGFFLIGTLDLPEDPSELGSEVDRLHAFVRRTDPEALFVLGTGAVHRVLLEPMATELRLVIRSVTPEGALLTEDDSSWAEAPPG